MHGAAYSVVAQKVKNLRLGQPPYYDFNVWSERKRVEKLRYIHRNPVRRGLISLGGRRQTVTIPMPAQPWARFSMISSCGYSCLTSFQKRDTSQPLPAGCSAMS